HHLAYAHLVQERGIVRLLAGRCLVILDRIKEVLLETQLVSTAFQFLRGGSWGRGLGAVQRRRPNLQLVRILSAEGKSKGCAEEKEYCGANAYPGKHIHPPAKRYQTSKFHSFRAWRHYVLQLWSHVTHCGGGCAPLFSGLDGGGVFLSLEALSPRN